MSQACVLRKVNEEVEVWAGQGLAVDGRALAFMLHKMGNHWRVLMEKGVGVMRSDFHFQRPTLVWRIARRGQGNLRDQ